MAVWLALVALATGQDGFEVSEHGCERRCLSFQSRLL